MNSSILPKGSRLVDGIQYLAAYIALDGAYVIARKTAAVNGSDFDYYQVKDSFTFDSMWPSMVSTLPYTHTIETGANLAILFNQVFDLATNSEPTRVSMVGLPNPLPVAVANRADVQKVLVTNPATATSGLTDDQLRAKPVPVSVAGTQAVTLAAVPLAPDAATNTALAQVTAALQAVLAQLKVTLAVSATGHLTVDNFPAKYWQDAQPVTGTFWPMVQTVNATALPLPDGAATAQGQASDLAQLTAINTKLGATLAVTGPATDAQLRAAPLPVAVAFPGTQAVSGTFWQATQPVSIAALPLPSGAATEATLAAIKTSAATSATAAGQASAQTSLDAIKASTAAGATAAGQASQQTSLDAIKGSAAASATAAKQDEHKALLQTVATNSGTAATATLQTALNNTVATSAKQDAQTALQTTANTYLQTLASAGFTATVAASAATPLSLVSAIGNNATLVKAGATQLFGLTVTNAATSYRYLNVYNLNAAPATGATPLFTLGIPPNQSISFPIPSGKYLAFSAGLSFAVGTSANLGTLVAGVLGTTGVSANDLVLNLTYV